MVFLNYDCWNYALFPYKSSIWLVFHFNIVTILIKYYVQGYTMLAKVDFFLNYKNKTSTNKNVPLGSINRIIVLKVEIFVCINIIYQILNFR